VWADAPEGSPHAAFRAQIDDWLAAVRSGRPPYLSGASALATVKLIEDCYRQVKPLGETWVEEGLREGDAAAGHPARAPLPAAEPGRKARRRVLVTGAAGFIGCRLAEVLHSRGDWDVRALVHSPANASRLARLPVEMVLGDVRAPADVARAVEGCEAVIHCAYGRALGNRRETFAVTVDGTRNLAEAARVAGVRRFVHVSTTAVHGTQFQGEWDESAPVRPDRDDYAESKAKAESVVARAARRGLSATTVRLTRVYGPFSGPFTVRPVESLRRGEPVLVGTGGAPSNTVYVDNVVHALLLALEAPDDKIKGQVFTISDDDVTWAAYHEPYARALGLPMRAVSPEELQRLRAQHRPRSLSGRAASWYRGCKDLATCEETQALARRFLQTDPLGALPRRLLQRLPRLRQWLRRRLGLDRPFIYRSTSPGPAPQPPLELLEMYACPARANTDKARRVLGYTSVVPRERAMELTLDWLRHARLI
jgi:nucleoside-diphosphate-sugar epimerase